ncbi:pseudouridine synthase [Shewanella maritima]|uniref:pseudouridine synthase n=1 Tax=Shewanella maritima TaxID=2520507 RepID=UPI0037361DDF
MSASPAIAAQPSYIVLPRESELNGQHFATVLAFLQWRFAQIPAEVWLQRIERGKVHWQGGELITVASAYAPTQRVYYYREVEAETKVPFEAEILHQDEHSLIVYKPHFLPVTPGGNYVNECLVHRLRIATGIDTIAPAHRLDKDTAGLVLFSTNPDTRHLYHQLFLDGAINKQYQAVAKLSTQLMQQQQASQLVLPNHWTVKNRMKPANPSFTMAVVEGEANTHSEISLVQANAQYGLFKLSPITGKTHQLRVHMQSLGMPILHDRFYPTLQPKGPDNFAKPLQLLAQSLNFIDPITQQKRHVEVEGLSLPDSNCD